MFSIFSSSKYFISITSFTNFLVKCETKKLRKMKTVQYFFFLLLNILAAILAIPHHGTSTFLGRRFLPHFISSLIFKFLGLQFRSLIISVDIINHGLTSFFGIHLTHQLIKRSISNLHRSLIHWARVFHAFWFY